MAATFSDESEPGSVLILKWTLTENTNGEAKRIGAYADKSFGIWGTFGGTVTLQGNWDPNGTPDSNGWFTLKESDNTTNIAVTEDSCGVVLENPVWIRPIAGAGVSSVTVIISAPWRRNM